MDILFLVFIKPIINRVKYMRMKDWIYIFIFISLILSPSFLFKLNGGGTVPTINFYVDTLATFILFIFSILIFGLTKHSYKKVANLILPEYMFLLKLVPSRFKVLLFYSQLRRALSMIVITSTVLIMYLLMSGEKIGSVMALTFLVSAILIFIRVIFIVFPALISFLVVTKRQSNILKTASIILMIVTVFLYIFKYNYKIVYLPHYLLATGFHLILTRNADNALFFGFLIMLYTIVVLTILMVIGLRGIKPSNIYEASLYQTKLQNKVSNNFIGFTQMFPFLTQKLKLIAAKETLQFLNEYNNLVTILFNAALLVIIAIIGKNSVPFSIEKSIIFSSVAYLSFYVGLTSIARDINNIWIYKLAYPRWVYVAIAKYASSFINACFTFLFFLPILVIVAFFTNKSVLDFFGKGLHWSIILVPFAAISLGMLLSTILPVNFKGNDEKIIYNYHGIEGLFYLIVVLIVAAPTIIIENSSILYVSVISCFYCILIIYSLYRLSKKMMCAF